MMSKMPTSYNNASPGYLPGVVFYKMKGCIDMDNKNYEIKMDGKEHKFGEATRYTKDGKGRFDLIPGDVMAKVIEYVYKEAPNDEHVNRNYCFRDSAKIKLYGYAMSGNYIKTIVMLSMFEYHDAKTIPMMYTDEEVVIAISRAINKMLYDLAVHFQKGAEKYGERNCEKGIPEWSFKDSGLRHMCQYLNGKDDENHFIAAIWNFWMAEWTVLNHPERCIGYKAPINLADVKKNENESTHKSSDVKYKLKNDKMCYKSKNKKPVIEEEPISKTSLKSAIDNREVLNALKPLITTITHQPKFASWLKETYSYVDVWDIYVALFLYEYDEPFFLGDGSVNTSMMEKFVHVLPAVHGIISREVVDYDDCESSMSGIVEAYGRFIFSKVYELSHTFKMPIGKFIDTWRRK